jgi:hypothetical protein
MRALPPRCREILALRRIEGLSHREIAERLGIAEGTVNAQACHRLDPLPALSLRPRCGESLHSQRAKHLSRCRLTVSFTAIEGSGRRLDDSSVTRGLSPARERELACWLQADARHAAAFEALAETWSLMGEARPVALVAPKGTAPHRMKLGAFPAMLAMAAAIAVAYLGWWRPASQRVSDPTAPFELKSSTDVRRAAQSRSAGWFGDSAQHR